MPLSNMPLGVDMTYSVRGEQTNRITVYGMCMSLKPLAWEAQGESPGHEPPKPAAGSYAYSGRHDGGLLVPPRGITGVTELRAAVLAAQQLHNEYLTQEILRQEAASTTATTATPREPLRKRSKGLDASELSEK